MKNQNELHDHLMKVAKSLSLLSQPIKELINGYKANTLPWVAGAIWMGVSLVVLSLKLDWWVLSHTRLSYLYPYYPWLYKVYAFSISTLVFWLWAWREVKRKKDKLELLTEAFKNAGLESKIGRLPHLISDKPLDPMTRKMRLTNAGFPLSSFQVQGKFIESQLGIFIDEIKESRERRSLEIIYSYDPMPSEVLYLQDNQSRAFEFIVGQTRSKTLSANLRSTPHLLVAGQTGGGKSTFLRQFIIHLHLQKKMTEFLLIDLKGGLEFSLFENRKHFSVVPHVLAAVEELKKVDRLIDERMAFLKSNQLKDIDSYFKSKKEVKNKINLCRKIIVVDEAAEMFLAGHHAKSKDVQEARNILSRIARMGRAVGAHLVVATQRPDSRSLDPQVKANLVGVICFQMMNDASSIAVLGNGRATDLPKVPGRAIWKNGIEMLEVQTPFLPVEQAEALLGKPDDLPENESKSLSEKTSETKIIIQENQILDPDLTE